MLNSAQLHQRRKQRIRVKLRKVSTELPRLCVHRTNQHTYAQITDVSGAKSLVLFGTSGKPGKALKSGSNKEAAQFVGKKIAEMAKAKGIDKVVFDRSGYLYHGRIKALADAAREAGLKF
ncbi:MAG: 50S ribosomal protein L18 [Pseudomonadota bacterium]|jgi:large subunit ribosomal protein L18|nr:50S ribosomal protein L18 [Alphaproteobacteria bacterium]